MYLDGVGPGAVTSSHVAVALGNGFFNLLWIRSRADQKYVIKSNSFDFNINSLAFGQAFAMLQAGICLVLC